MIIKPDTYNVVDLNKLLVAKYKDLNGIANYEYEEQSSEQYDIHVTKLFAKHIKPEEQVALLGTKHPNGKYKRVLNIYIGTPNRLLKLHQMKAYDIGTLSDRFRYLVIDCRLNKKNFTIFENKETKSDTLDLLIAAKDAFKREGENKLKVIQI